MIANHIIAPSILAADFANLGDAIAMINASQAQWVHFDVMDGLFVPNISFGMPVLAAIRPLTQKVIDVHLMIQDPGRYIETFRTLGADVITVHYEACTHLHRVIHQIKESGAKAGVALNPHTPVSVLEDVVADLDLVLIMTVNPGFGGQRFIPRSYDRVRQARQLIARHNPNVLIEVDGGVSKQNVEALLQAGVDVFVAGNSVFSAANPIDYISDMLAFSGHNTRVI